MEKFERLLYNETEDERKVHKSLKEEFRMHSMKRRVMGSMMAVLMGASTILGTCPTPLFAADAASVAEEITVGATDVDASNSYGLVSATEGNILHAWDWKFTDVTESIEDIAEAGYSLVQVSPCQVCESASTNNDWWKLYQPYDYEFGNSLGSEAEFKAMCAKAEEYGISIIVDVVANHMAGTGTGACGERKSAVDPWWTNDKFHNTNVKFTGDFDDNREMMVRSNIGMPDIATEREDVQQRMVTYLEKMLDMGADGFRYDAAKHIGTTSDSGNSQDTFWKTISAAVAAKRPDALVYGEILNAMPVSDEYYVQDGIKVTESQKGWDMKDLVQGGESKVTQKTAFTYTRKSSADKLITWVENHDTYLNHWGSTGLSGHANYMSDDQIMLAWSTVGARADAQALYFARPDGCSNPDNPNDNDASNKIAGDLGMSTKNFDWKDTKVASVNKFKNAMVGVGETTSVENGLAIIKRGNKGLVVTNFGSGSKNVDVSGLTGLADGTYTDASGQNGSFTVSGGKVTGSVNGKTFAVIYDANAVITQTAEPTEAPATEAPATEAPTEVPVETATASPEVEIPASEGPDDNVPETSDVPATTTPEATETEAPVQAPAISVDKASGTEFDSETLAVTIKLQNATEGTYTIDNGVVKKFTDEVTVEVGEGKIADKAVTLQVTAVNGDKTTTETYTYKKVFNAGKAAETQTAKKSAVVTIKNLMEVVADAAQVDAAGTNATLANQYATNSVGLGKNTTISVDGDISDWSKDMLIAQGAANDDPRVYRENSMYEVPIDNYALYGAYDDENLYLMWEMTNVQDVVAPDDNYPLTQGILFQNMNCPMFIAIDTGKNDTIGKNGATTAGGTLWSSGITITEKFNRMIAISYNGANGPFVYGGDSNGLVATEMYGPAASTTKEGVEIKKSGIVFDYGTGILSDKVIGIDKGYGAHNDRVVGDVCNNSAAWVDFNTLGHNSDTMDFHFEMSIPYSELGVSASDVKANGLGVLLISTMGKSGLDCLPYDVSMNDQADLEDTESQPNNSFEKSDEDNITCAFARLATGDVVDRDDPILGGDKTPAPATPGVADPDESAAPATPVVTESDSPDVKESALPDTTATPAVEESAIPDVNPSATPAVVDKTETDQMVVNFGANLSAPQAEGTQLTLEAKPQNASGDCEYQFTVDGNVIREYASEATCSWTATDGAHTIAVAVKDSEGKILEVSKKYTAEKIGEAGEATDTPDAPNAEGTTEPTATTSVAPTTGATQTPATSAPVTEAPIINDSTQDATATPVPTAASTKAPTTVINNNQVANAGVSQMKVDFVFGLASPQKKGTKISISPKVEGGSGAYTYKVTASLQGSSQVDTIAENVSGSAVSTWTPAKEGTYQLTLVVTDSKDKTLVASKTRMYEITGTAKLAINKVSVSKKKVKLGKKIKISAKGTASTGKLKFKFAAKKGSKTTVIKKFSTAKTCTWKPAKAGTYKIVVTAKDGSGKSVSKTVKIKVVK